MVLTLTRNSITITDNESNLAVSYSDMIRICESPELRNNILDYFKTDVVHFNVLRENVNKDCFYITGSSNPRSTKMLQPYKEFGVVIKY